MTNKDTQLTPLESGSKDLGAVMEEEATKRELILKYIAKHMKAGVDFGTIRIGGRDSKPSLFKPGSEKFLSLFRLTASFRQDVDTYAMQGGEVGVFCYICELKDSSGRIVGEGRGAASMKEKSWSLNNCIKIAEKRAQIDAVLRTGALSDFFTQDLEDMAQKYDNSPIPETTVPIVTYDEDSPEPTQVALEEATEDRGRPWKKASPEKLTVASLKRRIMDLCNQITMVELEGAQEYHDYVKANTGLVLADQSIENLQAIVERLEAYAIK